MKRARERIYEARRLNSKRMNFEVCNGEACITRQDKKTRGALVVPPVLGGCPVTHIDQFAFAGCGSLTSLTLPPSVRSIGVHAFNHCVRLRSMTISSGLRQIGEQAFRDCFAREKFVVDPANPVYRSENGLLIMKKGERLVVGVNGDVVIPEGVKAIDYDAFGDCRGLKSVRIPKSVKRICPGAFDGCGNDARFVIARDNPAYVSRKGFIFSKDGKTLIAGGCGHVTIPDGVTHIGSMAFRCRRGLKSVKIPPSVRSIGSFAFDGCSGLVSVTIPSSVKEVGAYAFCRCTRLRSVVVSPGVRKIGNSAFAWCGALKSIAIPSSVTRIGEP